MRNLILRLTLLLAAVAVSFSAYAQQTVKGVVQDENGAPVEKATVQFCSDVQCMMGKTDAQGLATFEVPEGNYTVHILKVPEGYEKNPDEFTLPATYSDLSIVLKLS